MPLLCVTCCLLQAGGDPFWDCLPHPLWYTCNAGGELTEPRHTSVHGSALQCASSWSAGRLPHMLRPCALFWGLVLLRQGRNLPRFPGRRPGAAHRERRRAEQPAGPHAHVARHGRAHRRRQVPVSRRGAPAATGVRRRHQAAPAPPQATSGGRGAARCWVWVMWQRIPACWPALSMRSGASRHACRA